MNFTKNIVIVFGGQSSEHEATRKSFEYLAERINQQGLKENLKVTHVIYITRDGEAIISEFNPSFKLAYYEDPARKTTLTETLSFIKDHNLFVYGILYGQYGEDGRLKGAFDLLSLESNLGSVVSCSIGMSKYHLNRYVENHFSPIKIPETICVKNVVGLEKALGVFKGKEIVIKPNSLGSSILTERFRYDEKHFSKIKQLIKQILEFDNRALVQEYIKGTEYSCGCLEKGGKTIVLPAIRIETLDHFFGQKEKFLAGYSKEIVVTKNDESSNLKHAKIAAKAIFEDLDFQNAVRFDYIINDEGVYFLEANPLPGILRGSILPKMMRTLGLDVEDLVEIVWNNQRLRKKLETEFTFEID